MANDVLVVEPQTPAAPNTDQSAVSSNDVWRKQLAQALNEPVQAPSRGERVLSALGWALYVAAMLAALKALWAVGDTVRLMLGR